MVRKVGLVVVLLAAGVAIALYLRGGFGGADAADNFEPQTDASAAVRLADLEKALAAQIDRARSLEKRVAELEGRTGVQPVAGNAAWGGTLTDEQRAERVAQMRQRFGEEGPGDPAQMRERMRERTLESLVAAGFTRERAEWIERRSEELEVAAMQAQYDAQRSGRPQGQQNAQRALRAEMGDAEYERYLGATGRPTQVQVMDVLASSSAERSGLQPGDQIVSYAGARVFDMRELESLTREGSAGESVIVELRRNGQTVQVQVPRGPLGVAGGGRGGPGGGGPPGFRGGRN